MADRTNHADGEIPVAELNMDAGRVLVEVDVIRPATVRVCVHVHRGASTEVDFTAEQAAIVGRLMSLTAPNNRLGAALSTAALRLSEEA